MSHSKKRINLPHFAFSRGCILIADIYTPLLHSDITRKKLYRVNSQGRNTRGEMWLLFYGCNQDLLPLTHYKNPKRAISKKVSLKRYYNFEVFCHKEIVENRPIEKIDTFLTPSNHIYGISASFNTNFCNQFCALFTMKKRQLTKKKTLTAIEYEGRRQSFLRDRTEL